MRPRLFLITLAAVVSVALACGNDARPPSANSSAPREDNRDTRQESAAAAAATPSPEPAAAPEPAPTPDTPIRKIDFANFGYPFPDEPRGGTQIRLRDGEQPPTEFSEHGIPQDVGYGLTDVTYGDLTGDGDEEAIVTLHEIHSGTGISSYVYIYAHRRRHRPVLLWSFRAGDRADGGLQKVAAENGELVVELMGRNKVIGTNLYAHDGESQGACCPRSVTRTRYRWSRGRFRRTGEPEILPYKYAPPPLP